jgi:pyrroline-5-carboxylate reductase
LSARVPPKQQRTKSARNRTAIVLVGAGRMGSALLAGWNASGLGPIMVVEPNPTPALRRQARTREITLHSEIEAVDPAHVSACVIAIKPQILKMEAPRLRRFAQAGGLVLSIAAGTSVASLAKACGRRARIVRAMPNLPGAIGHGMTVLYAPRAVSKADRRTAERLMQALGATAWVPKETMIDTVTAVSGSGPAYVFLLVEALAQAARTQGLPLGLAQYLARATVAGSGALLDAQSRSAADLRRDVTSPGGTTEAALQILTDGDAFARLLAQAVAAARARAVALRG